jgi:hypothetical protein
VELVDDPTHLVSGCGRFTTSSVYIIDIIDIHKYLDGVPWSEHCIQLSKHNSTTEQQPLFCIVIHIFLLD